MARGKYDAVLDGLAPMPVADQSYQDKVEKVKEQFTDRTPAVLALTYAKWRAKKELIEARIYQANLMIEALVQLLEESQEAGAEGWGLYGVGDNALRLPTGETVYVRREPYGYVKDKDAFRDWCMANGYAGQLNLWPTTMSALVKERLLAGEAPPAGTDAFVKTKVVLASAKEK